MVYATAHKSSDPAITTTEYQFSFHYLVSDESSYWDGSAYVAIPFGVSRHKASRLLREGIAAQILSDVSLVIDPEDILVIDDVT